MTDNVNHPSHYTDGKIEVIDFIEDKGLNFHRGNAVKYISRAGKKDPSKEIEDLEKAVWYLRREIERLRREKESQGQNGTKWDKDGQNGTRMDKMIKGKIPCAHKQCSNYSESGCELWNECPVFQADNVTPKPASRSWRRKSMKKLTSHDVSDLMMFATQKDCKSLKEMILANPDAPLLIFVGDEANSGEYQYESCDAGRAVIKELTLYGGQWIDRDDYGELLEDELADEKEYSSLSDEEFEAKIDEIVEETAFIRAIVIYVG